MIIPWQVDVPQDRYPFMNWLLIASIVLAFIFQTIGINEQTAKLPDKMKEYENSSVEEVAEDFGVEQKRLKEIEQSAQKATDRLDVYIPKKGRAAFKDNLVKKAILEEYFVWQKARPFILNGWKIKGLFGHAWLHGGIFHLVGNMLFLWIFGNAVCAKIGNFKYLFFYTALGLAAAAVHLIFVGGPMIGASGAIFGIVGMFLVFFPQNDITCYWIWIPFILQRQFTLSSYWMILFWFAYNIVSAVFSSNEMGGIAYFAHLGGFFAGFITALAMLDTKLVVMEPHYEKSLVEIINEWRKPPQSQADQHYDNFQRDFESAEPQKTHEAPPIKMPLTGEEILSAKEQRTQINVSDAEQFIRFSCTCGKKVKIPAKFAGKTGRCPACQKRITIPFPHPS